MSCTPYITRQDARKHRASHWHVPSPRHTATPHAENVTSPRHPVYINPAPDVKLTLPNIYADLKPRCESTYAEGHLSNTCVLSRRVNVWRHRVGALRRLHVMASATHESGGHRMSGTS